MKFFLTILLNEHLYLLTLISNKYIIKFHIPHVKTITTLYMATQKISPTIFSRLKINHRNTKKQIQIVSNVLIFMNKKAPDNSTGA
jgi:hypothetical protein